MSVAYATILRAAGLQAADLERQAALLSWLPPILGCVAILLAVRIVRRCQPAHGAASFAALLIAVDASCYRTFFFGFIDHHMFATIGCLGLVLARLRRDLVLWFATLTMALSTTPEATFLVVIFLAVVGCSELAASARGSTPLPRRALWLLAPAVAATVSLGAQRVFETDPLPLGFSSWLYFTAFQPTLLACVGAGFCGALLWVRAERGFGAVDDRVLGLLTMGGALVVGALLLAHTDGVFDELTGRLAKTDRLVVTEEQTVLGLWFSMPWLRLMSIGGVASLARFVLSVRRGASSDEIFRWLAFTVAFALGLSEVRWVRVASSLEMVGIAVLLFDALESLKTLPTLSSPLLRIAVGALALVGVCSIVVWPNVKDRAESHGDFCSEKRMIDEVNAWFLKRTPPSEGAPSWGIVGPWAWGHHLHILGHAPVVFDPLNNRYDDRRQMIEVLRDVWWSRTGKQLQAALARYGARYLVLFDPFQDITDILGDDASRKDEFFAMTPDGRVVFGEPLNRFAAFRLFASRGFATESGELQLQFASLPIEVHRSGAGAADGGVVRFPRIQIYEVKPGATIEGSAPLASGTCTIAFDVRWSDARTERASFDLPLDGQRRFRYKTALPAPFQGHGFRVPAPYRVTCGSWTRQVELTAGAIDRAEVIEAN